MGGFNGSGTYVRFYNWVNDKNNAVNITASRVDTEDNGFATGLSTCLTKDGQQTATTLIPFAAGAAVSAGTVMAPGLCIIGDTTTGIYQTGGAGGINFAMSGVNIGGMSSNGLNSMNIGASFPGTGAFTTLSASGNLAINTNKFTVAASSGNTVVAGTLAVTGASTLTGGIVGVTDASSAASGIIGEFIKSEILIGSAVSLTNNTAANVTSIPLTAGDWDITGGIAFSVNGSTLTTNVTGSLSTTSATLAGLGSGAISSWVAGTGTAGIVPIVSAGNLRITVSGSTTVYLVAYSQFTASTSAAYGTISARRRR